MKRYEGEYVPTPASTQIGVTPLLAEVVQAYTAHFERLNNPAMLKKVSAVLPLLLQTVGNKPIGSLTQTDFTTTFFDGVQTLPPRWKDYCRVHEVTPKEASARRVGEISDFTSPSAASATVLGRTDNGRNTWRLKGTSITYAAWQDNLPSGQPATGRAET